MVYVPADGLFMHMDIPVGHRHLTMHGRDALDVNNVKPLNDTARPRIAGVVGDEYYTDKTLALFMR